MNWKLKRNFRRNQKSADNLLKSSVEARTAAANRGLADVVRFLNIIQYTILWNYDLSCLLEGIVVAGPIWKRRLFARYLVLTMYECTDDFTAILGKPLRELLGGFQRPISFTSELSTLHKQLLTFHRDYGEFMSNIRNSVIAHREHDATIQIGVLDSLDPDQAIRLGMELMEWTINLQSLFRKVCEELSVSLTSSNTRSVRGTKDSIGNQCT